MTTLTPRPRPCSSCPYRKDTPSGIWSAEEYDKLPDYDGEISQQATTPGGLDLFDCHQGDNHLCSGWVGHRSQPRDLIALRIGTANGQVDPATLDYSTDVPLYASGAEAAAAGKADIENPSPAARDKIGKIIRVRTARGQEVTMR
jgi:hypothetical protein